MQTGQQNKLSIDIANLEEKMEKKIKQGSCRTNCG